jgi:hypothetical protein
VPSGSISNNTSGSGPSSFRGIDLSGFRALAAGAQIPGAVAPPDAGFDPNLPYQPGEAPTDQEGAQQAIPGGGSRVITEVTSNKKTLMTFLAGAMLLFILSMHMRWLVRRASPAT